MITNNDVSNMRFLLTLVALLLVWTGSMRAQGTGVIVGTVTDAISAEELSGLNVLLVGRTKMQTTRSNGTFVITGVPVGQRTVKVWGIGWNPKETTVTVTASDTVRVSIGLDPTNRNMGEVTVYAASRRGEKLTDAPAAIDIVTPMAIEQASAHGQTAKTLEHFAGVDVVQSGTNDFNVNARGFNSSINRRMLVLIDGRDPSTPLINLIEWNSMQTVMEDLASIEVVHGPGSALYGPNAYNGVINMRTYAPKEVLGTRVSVGVGEWETYRASIRHAGAMGDFSYKLTLGANTSYNYSLTPRNIDPTKPNNGLEYPGLAPDVTDPRGYRRVLSDAHRHPFAVGGTLRLDYDLSETSRILAEGGFSASGNEMYVNQTGRLVVQRVEKPFARLAYQSERFNVQGMWQRRVTPINQVVYNALAASIEESSVMNIDAQYNNSIEGTGLRYIVGVNAEYQDVYSPSYTEVIGVFSNTGAPVNQIVGITDPQQLYGRFLGGYGQLEWKADDHFTVIGALRADASNLFDFQLSPKLGVVFEPSRGHALRLTYNRSFLRPSYTELYRNSPAGGPVNLASLPAYVDSVTSAIVGRQVQSGLPLGSATPQWNNGNVDLRPETAQSFELGYKGTLFERLFVGVNLYFNRRADFISVPLGGVAPDSYPAVKSNTGDAAADRIADSVLADTLGKIRQANGAFLDPTRLSYFRGAPAFVVAPTNVALVNEIGAEISGAYFLTNEISVNLNYAYLDTRVVSNDEIRAKILPNTSRHRINGGVSYLKPGVLDAGVTIRYVEGFRWLAGTTEGFVPAYAVVNVNAGYHLTPELRLSINVFNLLDRAHYEVFGGTILRRQATGTVSYTF